LGTIYISGGKSSLKITIRPFQDQDQDHLVKLWESVYLDAPPQNNPAWDLKTRSEVQPELFLVAYLGDRLVGAVMAEADGSQGWVFYLGVDPDYRRQGIATALMKRVEATLVSLGCLEINLQIQAENVDVQAFYENQGYYLDARLCMGKRLVP
jgi:ribosomal protein S18 acetylase RimI-like enzyme